MGRGGASHHPTKAWDLARAVGWGLPHRSSVVDDAGYSAPRGPVITAYEAIFKDLCEKEKMLSGELQESNSEMDEKINSD